MSHTPVAIGLQRTLNTSFETAYRQAQLALNAAGFKIVADVDLDPLLAKETAYSLAHRVLVVIKPEIAQRALAVAPQVSVALLCQVAISQPTEELVEVQATDPLIAWGDMHAAFLRPIAEELRDQLRHVIEAVTG